VPLEKDYQIKSKLLISFDKLTSNTNIDTKEKMPSAKLTAFIVNDLDTSYAKETSQEIFSFLQSKWIF
jgi:hypothetical protein